MREVLDLIDTIYNGYFQKKHVSHGYNYGSYNCRFKPQYVPIIITTFRPLVTKNIIFLQFVLISYPVDNLVIVSISIVCGIGLFERQGCLGPGFLN